MKRLRCEDACMSSYVNSWIGIYSYFASMETGGVNIWQKWRKIERMYFRFNFPRLCVGIAKSVVSQTGRSYSFEHLRLLLIVMKQGQYPVTTNSFPPSAIEVAGEAKCRCFGEVLAEMWRGDKSSSLKVDAKGPQFCAITRPKSKGNEASNKIVPFSCQSSRHG